MKALSTFATFWQGNDDHMEAKAVNNSVYFFNVTLFAKPSIKILGRKMLTENFGKSFSSVLSFLFLKFIEISR